MSEVQSIAGKIAAAGIELAWFGAGFNPLCCRVHIAPAASDVNVLSRVCYSSDTEGLKWSEVGVLADLTFKKDKVAIVGLWSDSVASLPEALRTMAQAENVKIIALVLKEPLVDSNGLEGPSEWKSAWTRLGDGGGWLLACCKGAAETIEVARVSEKLQADYRPAATTPSLSLADPYASLQKADMEDEKIKKAAELFMRGRDSLQYVDAGKKRMAVSFESPRPSKSSRIVVSSPALDGPRILAATDLMKLMGYLPGQINIALLTEPQQLNLVGKSAPLSTVLLALQVAVAFKNHV